MKKIVTLEIDGDNARVLSVENKIDSIDRRNNVIRNRDRRIKDFRSSEKTQKRVNNIGMERITDYSRRSKVSDAFKDVFESNTRRENPEIIIVKDTDENVKKRLTKKFTDLIMEYAKDLDFKALSNIRVGDYETECVFSINDEYSGVKHLKRINENTIKNGNEIVKIKGIDYIEFHTSNDNGDVTVFIDIVTIPFEFEDDVPFGYDKKEINNDKLIQYIKNHKKEILQNLKNSDIENLIKLSKKIGIEMMIDTTEGENSTLHFPEMEFTDILNLYKSRNNNIVIPYNYFYDENLDKNLEFKLIPIKLQLDAELMDDDSLTYILWAYCDIEIINKDYKGSIKDPNLA